MTVLSVQKHTVTLAAAASSGTANLTGSPTLANCVPFITTRVTAVSSQNDDEFQDYTVTADFLTGPDRVRIRNHDADSTRAMVIEVTVVEFDSSVVNVYQGTAAIDNSQDDVVSIGGTVNLSKAWLYFTYMTEGTADNYRDHAIRGRITSTTQCTFDCSETYGPASAHSIDWYVVECQGTEWAVDAVSIQLDAVTTTNTATIGSVTTSKAFILGSHTGSDVGDGDGPDENLVDVKLSNATTVTATRQGHGGGIIEWSGFVVEFAAGGNENVYRGTLAWSPTARGTSKTDTIGTAVTIADSMVHLAGQTGILGGGHWKRTTDSSNRCPDTFTAWTITGTTEVTLTKMDNDDTGGETDQDLSWEVIEWDVGGAPAPTRRVMVIS